MTPMDFLCMCSESELCRFQGGGIYAVSPSVTLHAQDCAITGNTARDVSVQQNSKPLKIARFSPITCDPNLLSPSSMAPPD
eukprot:6788216-Prymnesium_polylepis.1